MWTPWSVYFRNKGTLFEKYGPPCLTVDVDRLVILVILWYTAFVFVLVRVTMNASSQRLGATAQVHSTVLQSETYVLRRTHKKRDYFHFASVY